MVRDRISREEMFSQICSVVSQRSTCLRSQVGALIVRDGVRLFAFLEGPLEGAWKSNSIVTIELLDLSRGQIRECVEHRLESDHSWKSSIVQNCRGFSESVGPLLQTYDFFSVKFLFSGPKFGCGTVQGAQPPHHFATIAVVILQFEVLQEVRKLLADCSILELDYWIANFATVVW